MEICWRNKTSFSAIIILILSCFDCSVSKKISSNTSQIVQLQAPPVACPRDTSPYVVDGKLKQCKPGKAADCPSGFICYFDGVEERYICCGKTPGYCEAGQPFTNPISRQPQECQTDNDGQCKTPYRCESRNSGSRIGFCCLNLEGIEPPPIGCPWGTRPLRNINQVIVTCVPGTTNACPGDAICYFDSVERSNKCCGRDPGEGCPSGTKAFKTNNQIVSCTPGERTQECPSTAVCQWSYLIDRFQCCQADNGCPADMTPLTGLNNVVQTCVRDQATSCPQQYSCEFNFWISSYQCCGRMSGFCPAGQVAYLESGTNQVRTCIQTQPGICPVGYSCQPSTTGQFVCCGLAGQCPNGVQLAVDSQGRAQSCSTSVSNSCPSSATCLPAVGGAAGQFLCCATGGGNNQCPAGFSLQNGQVTQCNPSAPSCLTSSSCLQSLLQTGFFICCSTGTSSQCPNGFQPLNNQVISCNPSSPTACFSNSQCLGSVSQPGSYLCCLSSSNSQCPAGFNLQNNQITQCNPSAPTACFGGSSCLQSPRQPGLFLCCSSGTTSQCPSGFQPLNNQIISCNPSSPTNCFSGSQCLNSLTQPGTFLCCSTTGTSQCPTGYNLQNNQVTQCNPSSPTNCFGGSLCLQSPANSNLFLCCTTTFNNNLQCPAGFTMQNNVVTACTSNINCITGNLCLQAPNQPGTSLCCSSQLSNSQCPAGTRLQNGATISCNTFATPTTCTSGSFCLNSLLNPGSQFCCTVDNPATVQCPQGYQLQNNVAIQCNPNSIGTCFSGSSCLISPTLSGAYVCCTQLTGSMQCPSGYTLQNGQVTPCNPSSSTCFAGSFCLAAPTQPNSFLCCSQSVGGNNCPNGFLLQGGIATFCNPLQPNCATPGAQCLASPGSANSLCCVTSASSLYQCPNNLQPYMVGANFYFCTQSSPNCPAGSTCQQATNVGGLFLCCQGSTELQFQCPSNSRPLMTGSSFTICNPTNGPFCPSTYTCQQSTNVPNTFICCSTSSLPPTCPGGLNPYTTTPGQYVYCSATNTNCPTSSSCQIASNMANTYVCCSSSTSSFTCPGNFQIFIGTSGQVTLCTGSPSICPTPSTCLQASNNIQVSVCCQTATGSQFCPANQQDLYINTQLQYCTGVGAVCPQTGYTCQFSTSLNQYLCCGSGAASDICPSGQQPLYIGTAIQFCTNTGSVCPQTGYTCQFSNFISRFVCCGGSSNALRCLNNQAIYQPSTTPFLCNPSASQCPAQYDCSQSNQANQFVCCLRAGNTGSFQCVSGRVPYPNSVSAQSCSPSSSNCPAETACEQSNLPNQFICCNLGTRQPQCPNTWQALLDGVTPRRCSGPSDSSCPSPYSCLASDITSTYICCQFSSGLRCFTGAQPFLLSNGQPQQCTTASPNCPPNFSCQSSTQAGTLICCGASFQGNIFCPDGSQPYRVGSQPFYCGPTATCPQTYQCLQSSSPSYQVCCLQTSQSSTCLPGQQPLLVNNQAQTCRIANPQCQQGYICQQGSSGVYYCCQNPTCSNGITLLSTNGQPRYCNPASSSCPTDTTCQQAVNLPGNFICCISSSLQPSILSRCVGRTTYLPTGTSVPCSVMPNSCPSGNECSSFSTTGSAICCVSTSDQAEPICPSGEPFKDTATKQYHYCSSTNYVCPQGFVCKQMINNIVNSNQYLCCSSKTTCQFGWAPFIDRNTNLPVECNPSSTNACNVAGAPYRCQQSTTPGEYLCCMETMIAFVEEEDNSTISAQVTASTRKGNRSPSVAQKMIKWIFG